MVTSGVTCRQSGCSMPKFHVLLSTVRLIAIAGPADVASEYPSILDRISLIEEPGLTSLNPFCKDPSI